MAALNLYRVAQAGGVRGGGAQIAALAAAGLCVHAAGDGVVHLEREGRIAGRFRGDEALSLRAVRRGGSRDLRVCDGFSGARGLAVVMLLLAKTMLDAQRWADSEWRLVIAVWAYMLVVAGMWFTAWPWRLRDFLNWVTASETRTRIGSGVRMAFGLFVALLGFAVF